MSNALKVTMLAVFIALSLDSLSQSTIFESSQGKRTSTYQEGIDYYKALAKGSRYIQMTQKGPTDSGYPLHLVLISKSGEFDIARLKADGKNILLINNAIHPGEPDGVEASQMLARDILKNGELNSLLENTVIGIIPFYNIGGVLNRNSTTRVNQDGPEEYGFRGNARNYDLNRDFIKNDTRNAQSFAEIFHELDPDVLIDTHVSNGADYQYTLTMVYSQKDKLGEPLGTFLDEKMMPALYTEMARTDYEMTPYVNAWGSTPDKGWDQFFDAPRYSSGYAALFQTIAFQSETHMLKPFSDRVWATYNFLIANLRFLDEHGEELRQQRSKARLNLKQTSEFPITWKIDKSVFKEIEFKGYESSRPESAISGKPRLKYHREQPYTRTVSYYDTYIPEIEVTRPDYYIIPQAWTEVIARLQLNRVEMEKFESDQSMRAEVYYIDDYSSPKSPWEGHYFHREVEVRREFEKVEVRAGDWKVPVRQDQIRYIIETLEPQATDSFFRWNFFDTILQMKEGYSSYVFEDLAIEILEADSELKAAFEQKKATDTEFADSGRAQLFWIYQNSPHYEKAHLRYPIYRFTLLN